jgi:type IV pilus assembly protein PilQ
VDGVTPPDPLVSADGRNLILSFPGLASPTLQTGRLDLNTPGRVPQARYAPPLRPRAVAPPLGDMAVGTMVLQNRSFVNVSGPPVTLTLNNAPAKDALMSLARLGGYGFVYVGAQQQASGAPQSQPQGIEGDASQGPLISMTFQNESYARALNGVLLASGLQARLDGRTLLAGPQVSGKTFGPQVSKVYRLNQASAGSAADYLASLGASISKVNISSITSSDTASTGTPANNTAASTASTSTLTNVETYGASVGPLRGLSGTTDSRLQTITLVGDSALVAIAESYLKQIDLRQRQVALSVRILDVNLDNDAAIQNSFAFRYGNNFIVSDRGELVGAFGNLLPPNDNNFEAIAGGASSGKSEYETLTEGESEIAKPPLDPARINPGNVYPKDNFFDFVKALITSGSTKTLASPTLILSENPAELSGGAEIAASGSDSALATASIGRPRANESFVTVGTEEITSYTVQAGQNGAPNSCQPEFKTAGLTFGARVAKIDDNGFVTFTLSPSIAAVTGSQTIEGCGAVSILSVRRLDTGSLRVRDGQTLILTGVISDTDTQLVRKWPILGDIPLVGQFFRQSAGQRSKRELVILVTPRIINDTEGGAYGYGYRPSLPAARQVTGFGI